MLVFMDFHRQDLIEHIKANIDKEVRTNKSLFFVNMARFIGSKTDRQCKSRYQKKEGALLKTLDFPDELIQKYISAKKEKAKSVLSKKRTSLKSTKACNSMVKQEEPNSNQINTFTELKALIVNDCMPKIQNVTVKTHLERFIHNMPLDDRLNDDLPTFNLQSLIQIQPNIGFSLDLIQDPDNIYYEDYE